MKSPPLAKLTRPTLFGAIPRERLFQLLDRRLDRPAVWIVGPPGAGKTTLAAGYVEARRRSTLWFQVDSSDADPATFFHYLAQAASDIDGSRARKRLPALTPEYLLDLPGFTRRFFRELYARLPRPALLVLDNYQEVPAAATIHEVMASALEELPEGVHCVIVSRINPSSEFSRLVGNQSLTSIGWNELRLTDAEATAIALSRKISDENAIRVSYQRSAGWVTGLLLILAQLEDPQLATTVPATAPESVFNYFAGVLFNRLHPDTRRVLMATALLERITVPLATRLSQLESAGTALRELHERNCFVDRRIEGEPTYQVHALLREFLFDRVQRDSTPSERQALVRRSADALASVGRLDEAAALYCKAADWPGATALILRMAPGLLAQGRWQTLQQQIAALPREHVQSEPWLQYWSGACEAAVDMAAARVSFTAAFEAFRRTGGALGQMIAAAAIVESYWATYDDMVPARDWIPVIESLLEEFTAFPGIESELQVKSSLLLATFVCAPASPRLPDYARQMMPLIECEADPNLKAIGTLALMNYHSWTGHLDEARRATLVAHGLVADANLLPARKIWIFMGLAYFAYVRASYEEACACFSQAFSLIDEHGLEAFAPFVRLCDTWHHLDRGESRAMAAVVRSVEMSFSPTRRADISLLHHVKGWLAFLDGDLARAQQHAERALALGIEIGWAHVRPLNLLCLAEVLIEQRDYARAEDCVRRYRSEFASMQAPTLEFHAALVEAYGAERQRDTERCARRLSDALGLGRGYGLLNTLRWYAPMMSRLAAFALEHEIEPAYVRMLVIQRGLVPEAPIERWPWPIRIHTLGRFDILRDDEPIVFAGKAQHKPLELLKVLIALGGRDVAADKLVGTLWPSPPEDGGHKAFEITVHRLRKVLLSDEAIQVSDRHVSLDARHVWVDAWALERELSAFDSVPGHVGTDWSAMEEASARVMNLYRGHFLAGDAEAPWHVPLRNRLSGRFQRFVLRLGERWEGTGDWERACRLYERVIEIDPLAELFYRRQMICLDAQGRRAEALDAFRRCRQMLSVTLGIAPGSETLSLYRQLLT